MFSFWKKKKQVPNNIQTLVSLGKEFKKAFANSLSWQWDERFETVLLHVTHEEKAKVAKILEKHFSDYWSVLFGEEVPEAVKELIEHLYGLRPEQLLFCTNVENDKFLYCAWWPWQTENKLSLRIAIYDPYISEDNKAEYRKVIEQYFLS